MGNACHVKKKKKENNLPAEFACISLVAYWTGKYVLWKPLLHDYMQCKELTRS